MAKHTHGPLHVEHDDEALATYVIGPDGMTTACLSWTLVGGPSKEEQCANGVLYAASPKMLEALKIFVDACDHAPWHSKTWAAVRVARAVIEQTEGK